MLRSEVFRWQFDEEGSEGFVMKSMPHFDAVRGFVLAHDMLEHTSTRVGIEAECHAFGVMLWIRWDGGYWDQLNMRDLRHVSDQFQRSEGMGYELGRFLSRLDWQIKPTDVKPEPLDSENEELLVCIGEGISQSWRENIDDEDVDPVLLELATSRALDHLREGYHYAPEFYKTNPQAIAAMFEDIELTIDKYCQERQEGDEIRVTINEDHTWAVEVLNGMDLNGDYFEDGELFNPNDDEDE